MVRTHAQRAACVLRDAEHHALTREISQMRMGPSMAAYREVLGAPLNATQRAMLQLALSFFTWRTLVRQAGLGQEEAVNAMVNSIQSPINNSV